MSEKSKILRTAPIDVALVKSMFLTWKMRVRSALNGIGDWHDVHAGHPYRTDIGKWILEIGEQKYYDEPVFHAFVSQHQLLHQVAGDIQRLALSGNLNEARALLGEFDRLCDDFLKLIDAYKDVLEGYRQAQR